MRNDTQSDLDLLFKEGLEDARVKAPRGAWKAVSARLAGAAPAAAATPKRSWLLWGAPAFAFAAAAIAAVFFVGTTEKTIIKAGESIIAEVPAAPVAEAAEPQPSASSSDIATVAGASRSASSDLIAESGVKPVGQSSRAGFVPKEIQSPDQIAVLPEEKQQNAGGLGGTPHSPLGVQGDNSQPAQQEQGDDWKAPAESEAEAACPSGQLRSSGGEKSTSQAFWAEMAAAKTKKPAQRAALKVGGTVGGNDAHFTGLAHPAYSAGGPYTGVTETSVSVYGIPVSAGVSGRFHLTEKLAVSAGFNWSLLTRTFAGKYKTAEGDITHTMQYVGIPLSVSYDLVDSKTLAFYCYAGGSAEKAVSSKYFIYADSTSPLYSESVKAPQFGVFGGIGVEFKLTDLLGLYADPSVRYWFPGNQPKSIRTDKPLMFSLEAGLRFNF